MFGSKITWLVGFGCAVAGCAMAPPEMSDEDYAAAEASLLSTQADLGHGREVMPYDPEGIPLLRSFRFAFRNGDHEIRELGIMPVARSRTLGVSFMDKNGDDAYDYRVQHYDYLGPAYEGEARGSCNGGTCTTSITRPSYAADWEFMLVGFHLGYWYGDHEVQALGIQEYNGRLSVTLADRNDDDPFSYTVRYAYIPPSEVTATDYRRVTDKGGARRTMRDGSPPVIQGFRFDFWGDDNELRAIAVELNGDGTLDVDFSDQDPENSGFSIWLKADDFYTVGVDYAILGRGWIFPTTTVSPMMYSR